MLKIIRFYCYTNLNIFEMRKILKIILIAYITLCVIILGLFAGWVLYNKIVQERISGIKDIKHKYDSNIFHIMGKYSKKGYPINTKNLIDLNNNLVTEKRFYDECACKWVLSIPDKACSACLDKLLLTITDYPKANERIVLVLNTNDIKNTQFFIRKYKLQKFLVFINTDTISNLVNTQVDSDLYLFRIEYNNTISDHLTINSGSINNSYTTKVFTKILTNEIQ